MSKKKISTTVAFVLATASMAIPASAAQASVEWHSNGVLVGTTHAGTTFWGNWEAQNAFLGKIKCHVIGTMPVWNEGGVGKSAVELIATGSCASEPACSGLFMTAEAPVEAILTEKAKHEPVAQARRGPFSLPWQGEGTEKLEGSGLEGVSITGVKLTVVAPCFAVEVPFEGTLEVPAINGARNGLKPTFIRFEGTRSGFLTSKALPTGENSLILVGEVRDVGESVQLITLQ
jgi:hypothetical protein